MRTFNTKSLVDAMIAGDGWDDSNRLGDRPWPHDAPDNPPAIRIVEYDTPEGATVWGVVFRGDSAPFRYDVPSQYVLNPRVIWTKGGARKGAHL